MQTTALPVTGSNTKHLLRNADFVFSVL